MNTTNVLMWIENLPAVDGNNVQNILFVAKREEVLALVKRAENLNEDEARNVRNDAYLAALKIESDARKIWGDEEINLAKANGL
jgi:hypothetical protein